MAQFNTAVQLEPPDTTQYYGLAPRPLDAWQLATIDWGTNQQTGFVNKKAAIAGVPTSLVINQARIAPNGMRRPKREGSIGTGISPMQTAKVKFQDKGRGLSALIAEKRANGVGFRGKVLTLYEWEAGTTLDTTRHIVGTYRLDERQWLDGNRTLTGLDIRRQLKTSIFDPQSYRLDSSISSTDTELTIRLPYEYTSEAIPSFLHDESYSSNPSEWVWYVKADSGEIIKCPGLSSVAVASDPYLVKVTNAERGALNTSHLIESITVSADAEDDNKPELVEWIYYEETLPNLIKLITTGTTYEGRVAPSHHHAAMDVQWLDLDSLLYAAPEFAALPLRAENYGSTTVKDLIEGEILPFLPGVMQVNARGQIQLRRITTIQEQGPDRHRFDSTTLDRRTLSAVSSQVSHIKSAVAIRGGWDARTESFTAPIYFTDAQATAANDSTNDAGVLILESKLFHSSIHTNAQQRRLLPALAEHYLGEKLIFSIMAKPTAAVVDVGSRAHVFLEDVPDDATLSSLAGDINRSFLVTAVSVGDAGTSYQFTGTSGLAEDYYDALTEPSLDLSEYEIGAVDIRDDLPDGALVELGGVYYLQPGTWPLSFRKKYKFMDGPFYHTAGSTITCAAGEEGPMFQLWVPHAWHSDSETTVITTGKGGTAGGAPGEAGGHGYAVPTTGTGSLAANPYTDKSDSGDIQITGWIFTSSPGIQSESYTTGDVSSISLSYNDDVLVGLPSDLSGYSGCGGGDTTINGRDVYNSVVSSTTAGGVGADDSAGAMIICRGPSMDVSARFIVNGAAGSAPVQISRPGGAQDFTTTKFWNQAGSASGPGIVMIGIDGPYADFDIAAHVEAYPGETYYGGEHASDAYVQRYRRSDGVHSHFKALDHTVNLSSICTKILYMPKSATVQEATYTGIDLAFINQRDNKIVLVPSDGSFPSDGNPGDMAVLVLSELEDSSNLSPASAYVMDNDNVWTLFDWEDDERKTAYLNLLQSNRIGGGMEYFNQADRPTVFKANSLWRETGTPFTWKLLENGPPDDLWFVEDARVSDNRFVDPEFTDLLIGGSDWVLRDNIYALPSFYSQAQATAITPTITGVTYSGGITATTATTYPLSAVSGLGVVVYSDTAAELSFAQPADNATITGYEVYLDGVLETTISAAGPFSYLNSSLVASSEHSYAVRAVNATERGPDSTAYQFTMDAAVSGGTSTLDPVTALTGTVYSQTALELYWTPPASPGAATGYQIFRDGVLVGSLSGVSTSSYWSSGLNIQTSYTYDVRVVGGVEQSDDVSVALTTNA